MSGLMRKNVMSNMYFNEIYPLRELSEIIPEIEKNVNSAEP